MTFSPYEIVLTGGPCAGKTTALAYLSEQLSDRGWRVLVAPEVATMFITGGVHDIAALADDPRRFERLQRAILNAQLAIRDSYLKLADALDEERCVILYDRADLDGAAYLPPATFAVMAADMGINIVESRDHYDAVVHLVTAAIGAEHAYTLANNAARTETVEQAAILDAKTLAAWTGHQRLIVIDNQSSFTDKLKRLLSAVLTVIGDPMPVEIERKFLVGPVSPELLAEMVPVVITQTYLSSPAGVEQRVRARRQGDTTTYYHTMKKERPGASGLVRDETERIISLDEYSTLLTTADPSRVPVIKTRHCFTHAGHALELDEFHSPVQAWLLECELASIDEELVLPEFITVTREVTDDLAWRNAALAKTIT